MKFIDYLKESVSSSKLEALYNKINTVAFGGELPVIKPKISAKLSRATGITKAMIKGNTLIGFPEIIISDKYAMDDDTIEVVLAHEMIHAWFFVNGDFKETHGVKFRAKAIDVGQKLGKRIPLTHDTTGLEISRPGKKAAVIAILANDGSVYASFFNHSSHSKNPNVLVSVAEVIKKGITIPFKEVRLIVDDLKVAHKFPLQRIETMLKKFPGIYKVKNEDAQELLDSKKFTKIQ